MYFEGSRGTVRVGYQNRVATLTRLRSDDADASVAVNSPLPKTGK